MSMLTIIQARLSSTRLPEKILLPIAGKNILQHVYDAAPEPKVVAVPLEDRHHMLLDFPEPPLRGNVVWYEGDVNDVLGRFYHAWRNFLPEATWILRLTADCPMLTRGLVDDFDLFHADYTKTSADWDTIYTNRPWDPDGYDMELFSGKALKMAHEQATDPYDREHVTPWLYRHLNVRRFSIFGRGPQMEDPAEKVSVDTLENYERVKALMEAK